MLGKLIKHEFKDTMRLFLPIFGLIAVLTPVFSLMMSLGSNYDDLSGDEMYGLDVVFGSGIAGYLLLLFGLMIVTQILIVIRFYQTMASSEAYLTFTLPAKTGSILIAKWLVSMIWYIIACILAAASVFTVLLIATPITMDDISTVLSAIRFLDYQDFFTLFLLILFVLISLSLTILRMYTSVMIGQLAKTHRVALSIGVYLGLSQGLQIIISLMSIPFFILFPNMDNVNLILSICCIGYGALSAAFYAVTYYLTAKKLNIK